MEKPIELAIEALKNPSDLEACLACAVAYDPQSKHSPRTWLMHVRFAEDKPQVSVLAGFLWAQCMYYALPRRTRLKYQKALDDDFSVVARVNAAVRNIFIEFNKLYPNRASELGEVLAYCLTQRYLNAPQVAAKMALKTAPNMPVHGLDGVHAAYESNALTIYFLESKLSKTANDGVKEYAESAAKFLNNQKQYLREYEIVSELGNLDSLEGEAREAALEYFDILGKPSLKRRERFVGVICYSETKHFANTVPVDDSDVSLHEKHFGGLYAAEYDHHYKAAKKHIEDNGGQVAKTSIFFVAVPNVDTLRELFYEALGIAPTATSQSETNNEIAK